MLNAAEVFQRTEPKAGRGWKKDNADPLGQDLAGSLRTIAGKIRQSQYMVTYYTYDLTRQEVDTLSTQIEAYAADRNKLHKREFVNERLTAVMGAAHSVMNEEQFKKLCDKVNAGKGRGTEDQYTPEMFDSQIPRLSADKKLWDAHATFMNQQLARLEGTDGELAGKKPSPTAQTDLYQNALRAVKGITPLKPPLKSTPGGISYAQYATAHLAVKRFLLSHPNPKREWAKTQVTGFLNVAKEIMPENKFKKLCEGMNHNLKDPKKHIQVNQVINSADVIKADQH